MGLFAAAAFAFSGPHTSRLGLYRGPAVAEQVVGYQTRGLRSNPLGFTSAKSRWNQPDGVAGVYWAGT
jgi:hypothetical protein